MIIKKFSAENFRNIEKESISFSSGVNLLYGDNAQGKTNVIEGVYLFSRGKSFRAKEDKELLKFEKEGFRISIDFSSEKGDEKLEYSLFGKERLRKKNGYKISKIKDMIGSFKAVLFSPDDLSLVKSSPEERRNFLNVAISQIYPSYIDIYSNYKKALDNRNYILKQASQGRFYDEKEFLSWSEYMSEYASYIYMMRRDYINKAEFYSDKVIKDISDGNENINLFYKSDIEEDLYEKEKIKKEYIKIFSEKTEKEKNAGITLFGPHRDDMEININGKSSRIFASQGQQRSIVLSLKIAEGEIIKELCGEYPVFLFDDVLSELDEKRKRYIIKGKGEKQILISSCEKDENIFFADRVIKVSQGKYEIEK